MTETIKINGDTWIRRAEIRYLSPLSAEEQAKAGERYGIDGSAFKTRLVMADKSLKLVRESIGELSKEQGLAVITIAPGKWIPAANITAARDYTAEDAAKAREKGVSVGDGFLSRVETSAGQVLGTETAQKVMEKAAAAIERIQTRSILKPAGGAAAANKPSPANE